MSELNKGRLLRMSKVQELVGDCSRTTVWRMTKTGELPMPVVIAGRPGWWESEVYAALDKAPQWTPNRKRPRRKAA